MYAIGASLFISEVALSVIVLLVSMKPIRLSCILFFLHDLKGRAGVANPLKPLPLLDFTQRQQVSFVQNQLHGFTHHQVGTVLFLLVFLYSESLPTGEGQARRPS